MLTIRDMTPEDRETYFTFAHDFYAGDATLFPITDDSLALTLAETFSPAPRARLLMLEEEGRPVGYGSLAFSFSTEAGGTVCWVEELYLCPAERGKGYGRTFLNWVRETYREEAARLRLEVCPHNPDARRLYESVGFTALPYDQMVIDRK